MSPPQEKLLRMGTDLRGCPSYFYGESCEKALEDHVKFQRTAAKLSGWEEPIGDYRILKGSSQASLIVGEREVLTVWEVPLGWGYLWDFHVSFNGWTVEQLYRSVEKWGDPQEALRLFLRKYNWERDPQNPPKYFSVEDGDMIGGGQLQTWAYEDRETGEFYRVDFGRAEAPEKVHEQLREEDKMAFHREGKELRRSRWPGESLKASTEASMKAIEEKRKEQNRA